MAFYNYWYLNFGKEKRKGKKTDVRQAEAEYKISPQGKDMLETYRNPNFTSMRNMIEWSRQMAKKKRVSSDTTYTSKSDSDVDAYNKTEDLT